MFFFHSDKLVALQDFLRDSLEIILKAYVELAMIVLWLVSTASLII